VPAGEAERIRSPLGSGATRGEAVSSPLLRLG